MDERQRGRALQRRRHRRRCIQRRVQVWTRRILAAAILLLVLVSVSEGSAFLAGKMLGAGDKELFGARVIGSGEEKPGAPRIVLDAGHGGKDQGTCSGDVLEKDINLSVVEKLAWVLEEHGIEVILTRVDDTKVGLEERAAFANGKEADLFVSIHCNFCEDDAGVRGLECYYQDGSSGGENLAKNIVMRMDEEEKVECRGIRTANYRVLRKTNMPAVLVELGYFSNRTECGLLAEEEYQALLAKRIAEGILEDLRD